MKRVKFDLPDLSRPVTPSRTPPQINVTSGVAHRPHRPVNRPRASPDKTENDNFYGHFVEPTYTPHLNFESDVGYYRDRLQGIDNYDWADNYGPNGPLTSRTDRNHRNQYRSVVPLTNKKSPRSRSQPQRMAAEIQIHAGGVEFSRITDRIAALTFPTGGSDNLYRNSIKEVSEKLRKTYGENYKIFNVSQKRSDLGRSNSGAVVELGWPDQLAPPLDKLCSICKQFENWLNANPKNLVVIHCKGWRSRAAIVIASYMHYANVCSSEESVADRYSMQLFSEKFLQFDGQPSHKRYVRYFANLISGATKVNPQPIHLTSISFAEFPESINILLKIYERMKPVYNTEKILITSSNTIVNFGEEGLSLRGDFLVKCFAKPNDKTQETDDRQLLFQCQFNTCALELDPRLPQLAFYGNDLDLVDASISPEAKIEFNFVMEPSRSRSSSLKRQNSGQNLVCRSEQRAQSVGAEQNRNSGNFSRVDSYENFDRPEDDRSQSQSLNLTPQPTAPATPAKSSSPVHIEAPVGGIKQQNSLNTDGADSGIGSDSPKNSKFEPPAQMPIPPAVPPKPRGYTPVQFEDDDANESTSRQEDEEDDDDENDDPYGHIDGTIGRERKVLPALLRGQSPDSENPRVTKHRDVDSTSKIEPSLVAKGRYDPNSKCFSYVPAKSLKEHYRAPKKPPTSARRSSIEPAVIEVPDRVDPEQLRDLPLHGVELQKRAETPKWEDEINKLAGDLPTESDFRRKAEEERRRNQRQRSLQPDPFENLLDTNLNYEPARLQTPRPHSPPQQKDLFEQKKLENGDNPGGMDDLCDPEFYMTYSNNATPTLDGPNQRRSRSMAPAYEQTYSYEKRREPLRAISQKDLDGLNDMIYSSAQLPPRPQQRSYTPKPTATYSENQYWPERDSYRQRNSRSVNALPTQRKLSFQEPEGEADEWLRDKLAALKNKRLHDPDGHQRKQAERLLLEQLKNTSTIYRENRNSYQSDVEVPQQHNLQQRAPILQNTPSEHQSRRDTYGYNQEDVRQPVSRPQSEDFGFKSGSYGQAPQSTKPEPAPHSILKHSQPTPPTRDELRIANRQAMERATRSKTPSYQYDQDRATLVRQRSATPTILFPSRSSDYGTTRPESRSRATPTSQVVDPMAEFGYGQPSQRDYAYRQQTPESHYAPRSDYASRQQYDRSQSNYGSIASYQRDKNATPQFIKASDYQRRPRGATPTNQIVRQKPPTPPPQPQRSRSPGEGAISPIFGKKPQVVLDSERKYQERLEREAARTRAAEGDYQKPKKSKQAPARPFDSELKQRFRQNATSDEDEQSSTDFRYLNSMVNNENRARMNQTPQYATKSILKRSGSGSDSNYAYNNYGSVGSGNYNNYYGTSSADSMGSSAHSGFSAPEIYASPYRYGDETPVADPDYGSTTGRSETPAFPTHQQSGNQTPLPYHPLLYQNAQQQQYQNGR
ncbi:unnamed protein product [Bursaphelenchus okinawaensis]|uniref:Phosphatase tensin-type domain-containing protein n=1 Tax=Bursaphelenchus okinawaensis TaxID=465554 RepID=A0A811JPQ4_9BILA|nr:unnamed protein product [Bursaphelenchus okinawaensis]CAG9076859.1 unnamed protein product [Bursaphelenchus okinawaensis]